MKTRLVLLLALAAPLPVMAAPTKKATTAVKKTPILIWPRLSLLKERGGAYQILPLHELLNFHGVRIKINENHDAQFDAQTEVALKKFQRKHGLVADGIADGKTWERLVFPVKRGDKGSMVRIMQNMFFYMTSEHNSPNYEITPDGIFGFQTERAVRTFQREEGLKVDGIVGLQTWCVLLGGQVKK